MKEGAKHDKMSCYMRRPFRMDAWTLLLCQCPPLKQRLLNRDYNAIAAVFHSRACHGPLTTVKVTFKVLLGSFELTMVMRTGPNNTNRVPTGLNGLHLCQSSTFG